MADDFFFSPNRVVPARLPRRGEPLWELRKDHVTWSCELRFEGESWGCEAQILREGELHMAHLGSAGSSECQNDFAGAYQPVLVELEVYSIQP
jgi:hypothetical protein